ncbi:hypothetical protein SY88_13410 [Clostridiales bacterium PH28_bin88]|nr:hypothetical protein SY88_13410 [Clostridiales bacterium PH28_bin88]
MAKLAYVTGVEAVELAEGNIFITIGAKVKNLARTEVYGTYRREGDTIMVDACEREKKLPPDVVTTQLAGRRLIKLRVVGDTEVRRVVVRGANGLFASRVQ